MGTRKAYHFMKQTKLLVYFSNTQHKLKSPLCVWPTPQCKTSPQNWHYWDRLLAIYHPEKIILHYSVPMWKLNWPLCKLHLLFSHWQKRSRSYTELHRETVHLKQHLCNPDHPSLKNVHRAIKALIRTASGWEAAKASRDAGHTATRQGDEGQKLWVNFPDGITD